MRELKDGDTVTLRNGETARVERGGVLGTAHGERIASNGIAYKESWNTRTGWSSEGDNGHDIVRVNGESIVGA